MGEVYQTVNRSEAGQSRHAPNAGLMLGQRSGRWPSITPALGECIVFSGQCLEKEEEEFI